MTLMMPSARSGTTLPRHARFAPLRFCVGSGSYAAAHANLGWAFCPCPPLCEPLLKQLLAAEHAARLRTPALAAAASFTARSAHAAASASGHHGFARSNVAAQLVLGTSCKQTYTAVQPRMDQLFASADQPARVKAAGSTQ